MLAIKKCWRQQTADIITLSNSCYEDLLSKLHHTEDLKNRWCEKDNSLKVIRATNQTLREYVQDLKYQCEEIIRKKTNKFHIVRLPIVHSLGKPVGASRGSFIDKILIDLKAGKEVRVFKNVQRCFLRVEELFDVFEIFINDTRYGTYHVGTKVMSYYDRLCALCDELGIDWKDKIIPVDGNIDPLVQNLNTDKLKNTFGIILT